MSLGSDRYRGREVTLPSGEGLAHSLDDFRELYRTYYGYRHSGHPRDRTRSSGRGTITPSPTIASGTTRSTRRFCRTTRATRTPTLRSGPPPLASRPGTSTPRPGHVRPTSDHLHDAFRLRREFRFGDLLTLLVTDERLYRSPPPCYDRPFPSFVPAPLCPGRAEPDRTILDRDQHRWLVDRLGWAPTRWAAWATEVLSLPFNAGAGPLTFTPLVDSWDGYAAERARLFDAMANNDRSACPTLTGDLRSYIVGEQRRPPASVPRTPPIPRGGRSGGAEDGDGTASPVVGFELMTPAVTSVNLAEAVGVEEGIPRAAHGPLFRRIVRGPNSHFDLLDSHHWGYATVTITRDDCRYIAYAVDKTVDDVHAPKRRLADLRAARDRLV